MDGSINGSMDGLIKGPGILITGKLILIGT